MKTSELTGAALDWAVAVCEHNVGWEPEGQDRDHYSTDWAQGGPIIEREKLSFCLSQGKYVGFIWNGQQHLDLGEGPTPLIAAMRCYVASKLGESVEVPEELI